MTAATQRFAALRSTSQHGAPPRDAARRAATPRNATRRYYVPIVVIARVALERGPLIEHRVMTNGRGQFWRHGNRLFSAKTVRLLIDAGEAVRVGDSVIKLEGR